MQVEKTQLDKMQVGKRWRTQKRNGLYLGLMVCLVGVVFCGGMLIKEWLPGYRAEMGYREIRKFAFGEGGDQGHGIKEQADQLDQTPEERQAPDFEALQKWNPDIRGWIWGPGTDIDYPVVQGDDNEFYLNHTADRKASVIGAIFMESMNQGDFSDDVTVLYGHHIRGGRMFSSLSEYKRPGFYEEHSEMILYTPEKNYLVEVFAGRVLDGGRDRFVLTFAGDDSRKTWLDGLVAESVFQSSVRPGEGDRILVLCTCTYEYSNARFAVYGVIRELSLEME